LRRNYKSRIKTVVPQATDPQISRFPFLRFTFYPHFLAAHNDAGSPRNF
jgi:hypothetical protein